MRRGKSSNQGCTPPSRGGPACNAVTCLPRSRCSRTHFLDSFLANLNSSDFIPRAPTEHSPNAGYFCRLFGATRGYQAQVLLLMELLAWRG